MFDDPRIRQTTQTAMAMCVAGQRRDLATVYDIWNDAPAEGRADLIAALAQIPGSILQAAGHDPIPELDDMVRRLAALEKDAE